MRRAARISSLRLLLRQMAHERRRLMGDIVEAITGRQRAALVQERIAEIKDELRRMDEAQQKYTARVRRREEDKDAA